jgi:dicarboxylate transporter DctA-like protein
LTEPKPAKSGPMRLVLALVAITLVLLASVAWMNRRPLAREALIGWLRSRGIASDAQVEAIGPTTFTARLRIGDPRNPDFTAERAEVRYRAKLTGLEVVSVKLRKPLLRAAVRRGQLSMGSLDPLVQEFLRRPPPPNFKQPRVEIDDGVLLLTTDYGPARVTADALVNDGQLMSLSAVSAPARLKSPQFDVALGQTSLTVIRRAGQFEANLDAPLATAAMGRAEARGARLTVKVDAPYPDLVRRKGDGALAVQAKLTSQRMGLGGRGFASSTTSATFTGRVAGWIQDLSVTGHAVADVRAAAGEADGMRLGVLKAVATSDDLMWTRKGGDRVAATVRLSAGLEGAKAGDLSLATLTATATGPVSASRDGVDATLSAAAVGRAGWLGLGAPVSTDTADMALLKRAARSFRLAAPDMAVRLKDGGATLRLPQPVRLVPDSGGAVELAARPGSPVYGPAGGAFRLRVAGGGLPGVDADVAKFTLADNGVSAAGRVQAKGSLGIVQGGEVDAAGRLQARDGGLTFTADRCVTARAERLEFDANDVEGLAARLCPTSGPLFRMSGGGAWSAVGRAEGVAGAVPFAQAKMEGGAGPFSVNGKGDRITVQAQVTTARLEDTAPEKRFDPLVLTGTVDLRDYIWRADLAFRQPGGPPIGTALVTHDGRLGIGVAVIETADLQFADGGLQPAQISPLAAAVGSPVVGSAQFKGRFDWTPAGATSSGTVSIPSLDFTSPAGRVEGLKGEIVFASLAPLKAAAGQELQVEKVHAAMLLEHLRARIEVADNLLKVESGEALVGGGRIRVESLEIPLVEGQPTRGVLLVEGVQLHDLVEASPFGDKVEFDAKVSGRVPFEANGNKVRIPGGELKAIQPGRLSIDRTALTGVQAEGALEAPAAAPAVDPNSTFTDFAYQAMENLAFNQLEATIVSRNDGRLGVLFHIVGRHDPPQKQQIRLTVMDVVRQRFLGRPLPLPSGTGVNLTLDTSLNLDDLLSDYADYQRLHGSRPVQP